jgi:hypothetical protein
LKKGNRSRKREKILLGPRNKNNGLLSYEGKRNKELGEACPIEVECEGLFWGEVESFGGVDS